MPCHSVVFRYRSASVSESVLRYFAPLPYHFLSESFAALREIHREGPSQMKGLEASFLWGIAKCIGG